MKVFKYHYKIKVKELLVEDHHQIRETFNKRITFNKLV
jgi:hypothetical protein